MQPDPHTTDKLLDQARAGNRQAFAQLIEAHYDFMFRVAWKITGKADEAEDVTHEACLKLGRSIRQYRGDAAFTSWLYRLVLNAAFDWQKQNVKHMHEPLSDDVSQHTDSGESAVMLKQVLAVIHQMGEGYTAAVVLVVGEGLSHAEAAEVLEIKESTVSWRLMQVRRHLGQLGVMEVKS